MTTCLELMQVAFQVVESHNDSVKRTLDFASSCVVKVGKVIIVAAKSSLPTCPTLTNRTAFKAHMIDEGARDFVVQ